MTNDTVPMPMPSFEFNIRGLQTHCLCRLLLVNVDQDVDEPWPLEVYGHDGIATNVTMRPGDMVLYESHSVIHGRPFPLKGKFIHSVILGPLPRIIIYIYI